MTAPAFGTFAGGGIPESFKRKLRKERRGGPFQFGEDPQENLQQFGQEAGQARRGRTAAKFSLEELLTRQLADPAGTAGQFLPFFEKAQQATLAPVQRQFGRDIKGVAASTAARFGGAATSEEQRQTQLAGELFAREASEAAARVGPQAITAGQQQTQLTRGARGDISAEEAQLRQLILAAILGQQEEDGFDLASFLGTVGGGVAGTLLAGPGAGTAAGAKAGSQFSKSF